MVLDAKGLERQPAAHGGVSPKAAPSKGMRLGRYELGRTLGEGNFGKVKYARHVDSGRSFAVKILEKNRILDLRITDQIKREIGTLKLLKHPNVVRLHEVLASKTKICMVLEYVNGGELFDRIVSKGKLSEVEGRKLFQQLIDGVSYCHSKGVFHRDLTGRLVGRRELWGKRIVIRWNCNSMNKLENVLVDENGIIKVTDFGLSALPQHFRDDGLLHTTCGSPNYVAPEILSNRGYDGATSDTWSIGVILYVILTGYLPFDDRNLAVLYQKIFKGDAHIPKSLSPGARDLIKRILDPNPSTRITISEIKEHQWFKPGYNPANPDEEEEDEDDDAYIDNDIPTVNEAPLDGERDPESPPTLINAFQLIGMSSCLDLSGFFEKEDVSERKIRFTSNLSPKELLVRIENTVINMGFQVQRKNGKLKVTQKQHKVQKCPGSLSVAAEVFEISPSLYVVELRKSYGDSAVYRQIGCSHKKEKHLTKPEVGHFRAQGVPMKRKLREFPVTEDGLLPVGTSIDVRHFVPGQYVDVTGITRGKGFQGGMKRHGFKGMPASHGASLSHRSIGSTGQRDAPGKVFKGRKMPGRMGGVQRTVKNVWVYKIDPARNLMWVKGQVPGAEGNFVFIKDSVFKKPDTSILPFPTYFTPEDENPEDLEPLIADLGEADPFMAAD